MNRLALAAVVTLASLGGLRVAAADAQLDLAVSRLVELAVDVLHQLEVGADRLGLRHGYALPWAAGISVELSAAGAPSPRRSASWACMFFRAWNSRDMIVPLLHSIAAAISS